MVTYATDILLHQFVLCCDVKAISYMSILGVQELNLETTVEGILIIRAFFKRVGLRGINRPVKHIRYAT